ncbi:hypothetical protein C8Q77DRAFT_776834 [Trametes polyzona]|nr:hypothetical protein C8Q77DRAFT_776834 [Trametes polyzona]
MSDIEFVIEVPQSTRQNKKRPRLVTSCDHCRVKKIKCVQQPSTGKCEACAAARLPCLYRDREQYFAERTRMLSGAPSAVCDASDTDHNRAQLSAISTSSTSSRPSRSPPSSYTPPSSLSPSDTPDRSYSPTHYPHMVSSSVDFDQFQAFSEGLGAQAVLPTTWQDSLQASLWSHHSSGSHLGLQSLTPPLMTSTPSPSSTTGLFDPNDPTQPHPNLMVDFVPVFFDKFGAAYPFLSSSTVCDQFFRHRLSPLLANSIAASAARFSTVPEIQQIGPANATNVYCQMAKSLIPPGGIPASLDAVHALVVLSWVEFKRGRHVAFLAYARSAIRLASELGITGDSMHSPLTQILDPEVVRVLQATLQSVLQLHRTISDVSSPFVVPAPAGAPASAAHTRSSWGPFGARR